MPDYGPIKDETRKGIKSCVALLTEVLQGGYTQEDALRFIGYAIADLKGLRPLEQEAVYMGIQTPWGFSDGQEKQAEGMVWYTTPSHGGLKVALELVQKIPDYLMPPKEGPWYQEICWRGWFEEDCEWARVALAFPEAFNQKLLAQAIETVKSTWPEVWAAYEAKAHERLDRFKVFGRFDA